MQEPWNLYIIECSDGSLYTGITTDVERRFMEHQGLGRKGRGAKFFRSRVPLRVCYVEQHPDRSAASKHKESLDSEISK